MKNENREWNTTLPSRPGLYWQTVMGSTSCWCTSLVCISVEDRLGGSRVIRLTAVTPRFVRDAARTPKTEERLWTPHNNHMNEYFAGPVELPVMPDKDELCALNNVPAEPGLYYYSHYGNDGWSSSIVSVSMLRAHGFADQIWSISLPGLTMREVRVVQSTCYGSPFPIAPPQLLPNGQTLVMPVTEPRR